MSITFIFFPSLLHFFLFYGHIVFSSCPHFPLVLNIFKEFFINFILLKTLSRKNKRLSEANHHFPTIIRLQVTFSTIVFEVEFSTVRV